MFSIDVINLTRNEIICLVTRLLSIIRTRFALNTRVLHLDSIATIARIHAIFYAKTNRTRRRREYVYHSRTRPLNIMQPRIIIAEPQIEPMLAIEL